MEYCCNRFREEIKEYKNPDGHFEQDYDNNKTWNVLGCCGECYVITEMKFCPFCGSSLIEKKKEEKQR